MSPKVVPPCQAACPIHTDARGYISAIEKGDAETAIRINRQVNPLPAICGRICPRPCEKVCRRGQVDKPIAIAMLKRFAADQTKELKLLQKPEHLCDEKVAIIGGGPAGLAAAYDLALLGYRVTIFDALKKLGGMLVDGIPEFRLPEDVVQEEVNVILSLGVEVKTGLYLGQDFTIEGLLKDFQAVLLAIGSQRSLFPQCKGIELTRIYAAVDFLKQIRRGQRPRLGKHIVIIGGGHTAIDASRTSLRLGSREVTIIYRRTLDEMPADHAELEEAEEEGVKIRYLTAPIEFIGNETGDVKKVRCIEMQLGELDESGRRSPVPMENSEFELNADTIISAIGYIPEEETLKTTGISVREHSRVVVNESSATNIKNVFACGDVVSGPSSLIEAIASGKKSARAIHCYFRNLPEESEQYHASGMLNENLVKLIPKEKRQKMPTLPIEKRINSFEEVELGYNWEQAVKEAQRCLKCGTSELVKKLHSQYHSTQKNI
ncbi:MAG TPA: FAD-dependent oxidoreductase [Thermodesulfovibrionales bacterium]|nr:FAD-dependent oxidoreductase [Thermodesulfovibrionales bacterium]